MNLNTGQPKVPAAPAPAGRIVILGGGPTGLGAAWRLHELGYPNFRLFERQAAVGGLAQSFTDPQGFTWDIGGHVMFSHYPYYDGVFDRLMGDEYSLIERESWVRMLGRWVPFPFQNNTRYLPKEAAADCLIGLYRAQAGPGQAPRHKAARNFGEFIDAVFGEGIARHFMRPYNFKVWAHPPEMMNKSWIGERVAVVDFERALRNAIEERDDFGWGPNNRFKFPLRGGTGEFYKRFGPVLGFEGPGGRITLNAGARAIDSERKTVFFADGREEPYDHLLSTMPLDILVTRVLKGVPAPIRAAAGALRHSGGHMVGIGIRRPCPSTKSWMYFPESNCPFYRVTYLSNYSPHMTPDKDRCYSLLCETSESAYKPVNAASIVEDTIRGLENAGLLQSGERADIASTWHHHAEYSYPIPTVDRDDILAGVIPWLESRGIHSRGRFGMWKYEVSNTDHSLMQGVELVNRLLLDEPETTIGMRYESTADGREAAVHGRAAIAGSGETRPASAAEIEPKPEIEAKPEIEPKPEIEADVAEDELGVGRGGQGR